MLNERIFREYDIRGIAGTDLTRDVAVLIGMAFGSFVKRANPRAARVSVARDVRNSSQELASGVVEGMISIGMEVYDIGVCPTPLQYFSIHHLDLDGGVMITGSHNPPAYNGFKLSAGKTTIHGNDIQTVKEIIVKQLWQASAEKGRVEGYDIITAYKNHMLNQFAYLNDPKYRRPLVVVDAGNGTAGLIAPELLEKIGCDVISLYCEPDGNFPNHHPDPTVVEYIQDLIAETKRTGAGMGVGYDGDADRIGVVNKNGDIVWGDQLMMLLSRELLRRKPGSKVIADVKCSQLLFDDIQQHGGRPIMWKTGHSLIKQKMKDEGAPLAGEFSGHIFIGDRYFGYDDAIYTTLRLVEIMKTTGRDIKGLLSDIPRLVFTPEIRLDCPDEIKKEVVASVVAAFRNYFQNNSNGSPHRIVELNMIDGVRVVFEKGWGLIRASNTQPAAVMRVEARDQESLEGYRSFFEEEFRNAVKSRQEGAGLSGPKYNPMVMK